MIPLIIVVKVMLSRTSVTFKTLKEHRASIASTAPRTKGYIIRLPAIVSGKKR